MRNNDNLNVYRRIRKYSLTRGLIELPLGLLIVLNSVAVLTERWADPGLGENLILLIVLDLYGFVYIASGTCSFIRPAGMISLQRFAGISGVAVGIFQFAYSLVLGPFFLVATASLLFYGIVGWLILFLTKRIVLASQL